VTVRERSPAAFFSILLDQSSSDGRPIACGFAMEHNIPRQRPPVFFRAAQPHRTLRESKRDYAPSRNRRQRFTCTSLKRFPALQKPRLWI